MAADWNPALYRRFEDERTRPARELLARVALDAPRLAFDLGCGPGNSTELLAQRWPDAEVVGADNSRAMLASARERLAAASFPRVAFEFADIAQWQPPRAPDLIYANAALQWVPDHEALLPRLFAALAPNGVLAVQMPDNLDEPSHRLMREVAAQDAYAAHLGDASALRSRILAPERYYDLIVAQAPSADARSVDVWHTVYRHVMDSPASIVEWLRATGLRPFLDPLPEPLRAAFLAEYEARIAEAYPARADGRRLLAFPRLFIVATRGP
jgi:trans-aconitate 2-methyltransferase